MWLNFIHLGIVVARLNYKRVENVIIQLGDLTLTVRG